MSHFNYFIHSYYEKISWNNVFPIYRWWLHFPYDFKMCLDIILISLSLYVFPNVSFIIQRVQITSWSTIFHSLNFQLFIVAVFACFLILWTPHHVQRIMYIVITKLEISWTRNLIDIQETMHLIAGNVYYLKRSCSIIFTH